MKVFILPFGKIKVLEPRIAELIINEGVAITPEMVQTYRNVVIAHTTTPFSLLINKEHGYSYTYEALVAMGQQRDLIDFRAVVIYSKSAEMATQIVMDINKKNDWKIKMFKDRNDALDWLKVAQNNKSAV
ncbi:MAG: hypothetical protein GYB32_14010 [Algicola sp.]|nr:hypothetical protein [Algicola sp.]